MASVYLSDLQSGTYEFIILIRHCLCKQHTSCVCRIAYTELRRIASVRPYLQSATAQVVSSAITPRLDYCNSILAGLLFKQISCLYRVQNNAAKLVFRQLQSKYDYMTPLLQEERESYRGGGGGGGGHGGRNGGGSVRNTTSAHALVNNDGQATVAGRYL